MPQTLLEIDQRPISRQPATTCRVNVGFVLHVMQVAGAEVLVSRMIDDLADDIEPTIFCLDRLGTLGEELRERGVPVVTMNRQPGRDLKLIPRLAAEFDSRRIDVIHAHQYTPFFYASLAKAWSRRKPRLIFTEHGRHYPDVVSWKRRWTNRLLLRRLADQVNACSQFSGDALAEQEGFRPSAVEVIYNGIDTTNFVPDPDRSQVRADLGLDPTRRYVATVARFHPVKDHTTLLDSFAELVTRHDDVDLLLVGDGELRENLERQARSLGIDRRVHFWGVRSDVGRILSAIDVFVLPSLSEAASLTLLEAMASECAIVATRVGGNPELVRDGVDGLLTPRRDAHAMADAISSLLTDPELGRKLGASARERVLAEFRQEQTVSRFAELYRELGNSQRSRTGQQHSEVPPCGNR